MLEQMVHVTTISADWTLSFVPVTTYGRFDRALRLLRGSQESWSAVLTTRHGLAPQSPHLHMHEPSNSDEGDPDKVRTTGLRYIPSIKPPENYQRTVRTTRIAQRHEPMDY